MMGGGVGKNVGVLINLMNQNAFQSKILYKSSKLEHFPKEGGGQKFWTSQKSLS